MKTITLNNGVEMPMLGFGTFKIAGQECTNSVLAAIKAGYRLIDTAQAYNNEEFVGEAIATCGVPREELFIETKVNFPSFENAREVVESSLKKLRVEYLDLVLLHWPFGNYYAAWRELEKLYEEGKIRAIGVSNFNPDRLIDLIHYNKVVPAVNQVETHLFCQRIKDHEWFKKYNVCHQAYAPLGQGKQNVMFENPALVEIAKAHGKTPAQVALRFLLQNDVMIIPKSVHEERIQENADIFDFTLSEAENAELRKMDTGIALVGNPETPEKTEAAMKW